MIVSLDDFAFKTTPEQDFVREFKSKDTQKHVRSAVYGIYDSKTEECLYIGEAKWLFSRLNDHYNTRTRSQIKAFVENDSDIDIDAENVWKRTEFKYVDEIAGGKKARRRIESILIRELKPRYNRQQ